MMKSSRIIFTVQEELFQSMTRDKTLAKAFKGFEECKSNHEKVMLALTYMDEYDEFPSAGHCQPKNNKISRQIRQKSNTMFELKNKYFYKALALYNQSLCMAVGASEDYAIALANRSAVYLELGKPKLCLQDIASARESGYPQRLMDKINAREAECLVMIKNGNHVTADEYASHVKYVEPFVKPFVQRKESTYFGRYLVTTKRINPGDLLVVEEPFCSILNAELRFKRCWHCLKEQSMCLIPCTHCTQVMFCSKECSEVANKTYHPFECPIIDSLLKLFTQTQLLALRITIQGVLAFGSLAEMGTFLAKHGKTKVDAFCLISDGVYGNEEQQKFHQVS